MPWTKKDAEKQRERRKANPEYDREWYRRKMATDPDFVRRRREKNNRYDKKHRDEKNKRDQERRKRVFNAPGSYTLSEWIALKTRYDFRCLSCNAQEPFQDLGYRLLVPDHIIPPMFGGTNNIDNIQPLCISCNARKGTATTDYRTVEKAA